MKTSSLFHACVLLALCTLGANTAHADPRPDEKKSPDAAPFAELKFHHAPKQLSSGAVTEDWPRFLGPRHDGVSKETKLLKDWPATGPKLVWEMETGDGYATPSILNGRLVFFHRVDQEARVECLDPQTGRRHWQFTYPTDYKDRFGFANGPRCSPVLDDDRAYVYGADGKLHCLSLATGKLIWKRNVSADFKVPQDYFGSVSSTLIEGELLIVNVGAPDGPCVVAFDKRSGKVIWQAGDQWGPSCASPIPAMVHGKRRVFVFAGGDSRPPTGGLLCIDPAAGKIESRFSFRSRSYKSVNASSPLIVNNQVFISSSYDTGGVLLDFLKNGDRKEAWRTQGLGAHFMTPIHRNGYLYGFDGMGTQDTALVCIDLKTGKRRWRVQPELEESVTQNGRTQKVSFSTFRGSLLFADGHFLCLGEKGHLLRLDLSPQGHKIIARTWLFYADQSWSLPVLSHGLLYINQNARDTLNKNPPRLLCYDLRGE